MDSCCSPSLRCGSLLSLWTHIWFHVSEGWSLDTHGQRSKTLPVKPPGKKPHAGPGAAQQSSLLLVPSCFLIFCLDIYYGDLGEQPMHALCASVLRWCSFTFCLCCVRLGTSITIFKHMLPVPKSSCSCMTEESSHAFMQRTKRWRKKATAI